MDKVLKISELIFYVCEMGQMSISKDLNRFIKDYKDVENLGQNLSHRTPGHFLGQLISFYTEL